MAKREQYNYSFFFF